MKLCRTAFTFVVCLFVPVLGQPCSCTGGCDNTTLVFPGSGGRIVDVAYGKPANMSSTYINLQEGTSGPACMAVNGKTGTVFRTLKVSNPNCFHTAADRTNDWWEVDLGRNYTITNITIYRRAENTKRRMSGIHVEVDGQTCHTFPLEAVNATALLALPKKIDVTCTPPLTGRVVRLQKRGQGYNYDTGAHIINICEVQVWGCKAGFYGAECVDQCENCAGSDTCSAVSGHCPNGCQTGWQGDNCKQECDDGKYGNDCSSSCGHCNTGDGCHHINGTCPNGCEAGFDPSDPLCESSCPQGRYGPGCMFDCGNCLNSATCNATTGVCPGGCAPGWTNPYCTDECPSGSFGDDCSMKCTNCSQDRCNNTDGECLDGCNPGYQWTLQNHFCNEFCQNGGYGDNCSEPCGHCSGTVQCDPFTGTCAACLPQLLLPYCKVCMGNRYGDSCELNCSTKCGGDGSCEKDSGRCVRGCKAGYLPGEKGLCNETCEEGKYGNECSQDCGKCNGVCRHDDGHCAAGCVDGFEGDLCARQVSSSGSDVPLIGGVAGGVVLIALCAVLAFIIIRLKRRSRKRSSSETASPRRASNDKRLESGPSLELNGQAGLQDETGGAVGTDAEESNFYEGLHTPDDSDRDPYSTPIFKGQQGKGRNSHTYQNPAWHSSDTGKDYYNL